MEQIKTTTAILREARNVAIIQDYIDMYVPGSQITPCVEAIAEKNDTKYSTAYKVIKKFRDDQIKECINKRKSS